MPQILVWKCPRTNTLFESKEDYVNHLREMARRNLSELNRKKNLNKCLKEFNQFTCIDDLFNAFPKLIVKHYNIIYNDNIKCPFKIKYDLKFRNDCSNSHSAPRDGETNWGGYKKGVTRSYPGMYGTIRFSFLNEKDYNKFDKINGFTNSFIKEVGIKTGGGGYSRSDGGPALQYNVTLFASDWPNILEMNTEVVRDIIT